MSQLPEPLTERPYIPDYGLPTSTKGLLSFADAIELLAPAMNYWVCTVRPDGRPHAVPVWGVVVDGKVHFGGGPDTRKAKNLKTNPHVVVHSESGDKVVIVEGTVRAVTDDAEQERIDDAYEAKYKMRHGPTVWVVEPVVGFGWTNFVKDATRWRFDAQ
ncbi:MAG TPA: pyridoxamine 5'-phosphate oxidase family protein [Actinomycetota bacterium]|nr:pyridoxamine 5'-phosphate oxidase family protein [Actinomycetota bacterium]